MRDWRGWLRALLLLGAAAALALGGVYLGGEWRLKQWPQVPATVHVPPHGDAAEGARLAAIIGCRGCHGPDLAGRESCFEDPGRFRLNCPNLLAAREHYDDRQLVILLRYGRKRHGALVDFMPWDMYAQLTDADMGHLLAYIRTAPPLSSAPLPASQYSWSVRWQMLRGDYPLRNDLDDYDTTPLQGPAERGRYLASIACPECHAPDLRGYPGDSAPDLVVARSYDAEAFARLMREGITIGGVESQSGLMTAMARTRFVHLRPDEVAALKAYLDQRRP